MNWFRKKDRNLINLLPKVKGKYLANEPLKRYTWLGVGGPAEVLFFPEDNEDLKYFMQNKPYNLSLFILGSGSNLLVRDGGIPGVVIKLNTKYFKKWSLDGEKLTCGAGMKNSELKKILVENGIGGIEFLISIPGSLGGAIKTNAGCYGKELKDVLLEAEVIDGEGKEIKVTADDFNFRYRSSYFPEDWIVTKLVFKVEKQEGEVTAKIIAENKEKRIKSQPVNVKTAGSTFKNPEGLKAWELIKKTNSNNLKVNDAEVSSKHCNFLINKGNASAADLEELGNKIVENVKKETSIVLEWEVKKVGISK